jgi:hypothetical protein
MESVTTLENPSGWRSHLSSEEDMVFCDGGWGHRGLIARNQANVILFLLKDNKSKN